MNRTIKMAQKILKNQTTAIYVLALAIFFAAVSNGQPAQSSTKTVAHVKNIEKYLMGLDACLYGTYFGMESVYAKSPTDVKKCESILGKFSFKWW